MSIVHNMSELLKKELIPYSIPFKKYRFGNKKDGGYILFDKNLNNITHLLSYGINDDVSFDLDFIQKSSANVLMYDHTINDLPVKNSRFIFVKEAGNTHNMIKHINSLEINNRNLILKMDIEGSEWDILDEIDNSILENFEQMVIEFHNLEYLQNDVFGCFNNTNEKMIRVFKKINNIFYLGHIHGNNCGGIKDIPNTIECTYIRRDLIDNTPDIENISYPLNNIDYPNNPNWSDYVLNWWL